MEQLIRQIRDLLPKEKKFLHQIYEKVIRDHAYLWEELDDLDNLRQILLVIIKIFIEEHKGLRGLNEIDQEEFKRAFKELLSSRDALLQKVRQYQIEEIESIGLEQWIEHFWTDINKINKLIEFYKKDKNVELFRPEEVNKVVDSGGKKIEKGIKPLVVALWKKKIKTTGSCHGHTLVKGLSYPWVDLAVVQDLSHLRSWILSFNEQSNVRWEISKIKGFMGDLNKARELAQRSKEQFHKYISENQVTSGFRLKPSDTTEDVGVLAKLRLSWRKQESVYSLKDMRRSAVELAEFIERK